MTRSRMSSKCADTKLPQGLTRNIIDVMSMALDGDSSHKGRIMREFWLTKYCEPDPSSAELRRSKAVEKWLLTERKNLLTNARLRSPSARQFFWTAEHKYERAIREARKVCKSILGPTPSLCPLNGGFSGGATTSRRRTLGHPARKFLGKAHVTRDAYNLFHDVIRGTRWQDEIHVYGLETTVVRGNVMFTVPKSADIDRVAAKEPDLNVFLQKMFGNQIRTLLLREGVNLNDQSINAGLAKRGSEDDSLMTIDLSSASDSVTTELVRALLPFDWFYYLSMVRSPLTSVDGEWHENAMFSSMGNGFTFELESLIFYSLARAAAYLTGTRGRISVYGDDIIAPSSLYGELRDLLGFCGFSVNDSKSFHEGPFRESCGAYWYAGQDVKPFFIRRPLTRVSDLILFLNSLVSWASVDGVMCPIYEEIYNLFKHLVPKDLWGGQDLTSRSSLVTGDRPRKELIAVTAEMSVNHRGVLLLWLLSFEARSSDILSDGTIHPTRTTGLYRKRRSRQMERDIPLFLTRVT